MESEKVAAPGRARGPLLLFDGECGLCHRLVRLLLRLDRRGDLRFAPLQGPAAQEYLRAHGLPTAEFSTLVFIPDWPENRAAPLLRTDGVIASLQVAGRPGMAAFVGVFPRCFRNSVYRIVGHMRYRIFGPWKPRPLPQPEWSARFLR